MHASTRLAQSAALRPGQKPNTTRCGSFQTGRAKTVAVPTSRQHIQASSDGKVGGELFGFTRTIAGDMQAVLNLLETPTNEPAPAHSGARASSYGNGADCACSWIGPWKSTVRMSHSRHENACARSWRCLRHTPASVPNSGHETACARPCRCLCQTTQTTRHRKSLRPLVAVPVPDHCPPATPRERKSFRSLMSLLRKTSNRVRNSGHEAPVAIHGAARASLLPAA